MKVITPMDFGHFIASTRKAKQWSQVQLAQRIGKDQRFVSKLEKDPSSVAFGTVISTLTTLGIKMELNNDANTAGSLGKRQANDRKGTALAGRKNFKKPAIVSSETGDKS